MRRLLPRLPALSFVALAACACGAQPGPGPTPPTSALTPVVPAFEVHEWGLIHGSPADTVRISGPRGPAPIVVMAKPVLYFHRDAAAEGESALVVDVDVDIPDGRVVEHWPAPSGVPGAHVAWHGLTIEDGSCHGSRYPAPNEEPCSRLTDGCEASTLASVETLDSDCLHWPAPPEGEGPTEAWNHLFYRGERTTAPALPLHVEAQADGTLRVTATGRDPVPGRLIRVRLSNGAPGVSEGVSVADAPAPGQTSTLAAPTLPLSSGAEALSDSLAAAGLTPDEIAAFRRSWDEGLFGPTIVASAETVVTATIVTAAPMAPPAPTTSLIFVLPVSSADALATLRITPAPRAVRRAIVVWMDETAL